MDYVKHFRWLLITIIVLNIVDAVTTALAMHRFTTFVEVNPVMVHFVERLGAFLVFKLVILTALLLGAFGYLIHQHRPFPKLWENEIGLGAASVTALFYLVVVGSNLLLLLG